MKTRDAFAGYHPICNFVYFGLVTGITMFLFHPAVLFISLLGANLYHIRLKGKSAALFSVLYSLPLLLFILILNPLFSHEGNTILTWLPSGNPLTLEALIYGILSGMLLVSVITWFACYSEVMSSDKFIYLFGRLIPELSLIISMALRFVPLYFRKLEEIREARYGIGQDVTQGKPGRRLKNGAAMLSSLFRWALEGSVETAGSMRARGYGLKGRTACSVYSFSGRDRRMLVWLLTCFSVFLMGTAAGLFRFSCYPVIHGTKTNPFTFFFLTVFLLMVLTPVLADILEEAAFKRGISKVYG